MSQKTRLTVAKMTASVSLSDDESHEWSYSDEESLSDDESHEWSYSDEESGQPSAAAFGPAPPRAHTSAAALGPAPPRTSADGQHFAAGKLSKKNMCDVNGSVGKQMRSNAKLASLRAAAAEERRNKKYTGENAMPIALGTRTGLVMASKPNIRVQKLGQRATGANQNAEQSG